MKFKLKRINLKSCVFKNLVECSYFEILFQILNLEGFIKLFHFYFRKLFRNNTKMSRLISTGKSMDVLVKMAAAQLGHDQSDDDDNVDDLTLSLQSDATVDMINEEENKITPLFRDSSTETFLKKV